MKRNTSNRVFNIFTLIIFIIFSIKLFDNLTNLGEGKQIQKIVKPIKRVEMSSNNVSEIDNLEKSSLSQNMARVKNNIFEVENKAADKKELPLKFQPKIDITVSIEDGMSQHKEDFVDLGMYDSFPDEIVSLPVKGHNLSEEI